MFISKALKWVHKAVIFVVDSTDLKSFLLSKKELLKLFALEELKGAVFLVLANKKDLDSSASVEDVIKALELQTVKENTWNVFAVSAKTGTGVEEAFDWLIDRIHAKP